MRKILICLMFCFVLFLTGCSNKLTTYHEISYEEYTNMKSNGDTFPLVIGSSTCSACSLFKVTMDKFIKEYQVEVFYIDISKLSDDDLNLLKSDVNFSSTPTTLFIKNGEHTSVYYRIVGSESISVVLNSYKKMGFIKGE